MACSRHTKVAHRDIRSPERVKSRPEQVVKLLQDEGSLGYLPAAFFAKLGVKRSEVEIPVLPLLWSTFLSYLAGGLPTMLALLVTTSLFRNIQTAVSLVT